MILFTIFVNLEGRKILYLYNRYMYFVVVVVVVVIFFMLKKKLNLYIRNLFDFEREKLKIKQ